jgi:hypothetical protein
VRSRSMRVAACSAARSDLPDGIVLRGGARAG